MVANDCSTIGGGARRILLVEDNFLVATEVGHLLEDLGCDVVGPVPSVAEGLRAVEEERLHGAVLDINIIGGTCEPIALLLRERECPFFFITGYASPGLSSPMLAHVKRVLKPIEASQLADALRQEVGDEHPL